MWTTTTGNDGGSADNAAQTWITKWLVLLRQRHWRRRLLYYTPFMSPYNFTGTRSRHALQRKN